ncbi:hypothetical protein BpHYR1_054184 [Brachionus plicatilis]|uniref:Uncharacterized protein n=1 Tax=Brachionus plicatilis TaxID=10195 RepID=A0A3M7P4Z7_BRAPC|nr:hypothetical protein BpHYR1_054184 [Brachionus plicatilis]
MARKKKEANGNESDELESDKEVKKVAKNESPRIKKRKLAKIVSNRSLEENDKVTVLVSDPCFKQNDTMPFISPLL